MSTNLRCRSLWFLLFFQHNFYFDVKIDPLHGLLAKVYRMPLLLIAWQDRKMSQKAKREQILKEAWVGDAVLTLYVRQKLLREDGIIDGEKANRMTANRFLAMLREPSEVEAEIGRIFQMHGLASASDWIDLHLLPLFERQESKRQPPRRLAVKPRAAP